MKPTDSSATDPDFSPVGEAARRAIVGDQWVDSANAEMNAFDREWYIYTNNQLWGRTWARGIIEHRELSLVNMAMLAGLGRMEEFEIHFRIALERTKVPLIQIRELLLHITMYCGIPIGRDCFAIARRVLKEKNVDLSGLD